MTDTDEAVELHTPHEVLVTVQEKMDGSYKGVEVLHGRNSVRCGWGGDCILEFLLYNGHHAGLPDPGRYTARVEEVFFSFDNGDGATTFHIAWSDILED